ncbi:hypothetical protein [Nocardiopsis sp. JB363]|uniref:hypothetical protein n=1 Tax=Nocardiopsis sp. JB363 TaxID=1434837 RepID=UPI00097B61C7|nr:hypothetical protein [Nocardiopsis sp. JB363]SIO86953.1 hypothetical protein BQ8420_14440 [Nocardiopsis sp. JB363]
MADRALTPDEIALIDATVDRVNTECADAATMAARYDAACVRLAEQHDENVKIRRRIEALEDQLADARAKTARESALVSEARHERDTIRQETRGLRREAADLITGDRSDALHWAARQLRKTPMPTALTGPYWYGQGWKDAIDHLEDALAGVPSDAQTEIAEQAAENARLQELAYRRWIAWQSARRRASRP